MELDDVIGSGLLSHQIDPHTDHLAIQTVVKDGADGVGEIAIHKEAAPRFLLTKPSGFHLQCLNAMSFSWVRGSVFSKRRMQTL